MTGKSDQQFLFDVQLNWLADTRGLLSAADAEGMLHVATSPRFGGKGKPWTPEHVFLGAVNSSFMTTYLAFAKKLHFNITKLSCNAIGQIEIIKAHYKFTHINLYPRVYVADESYREKATVALEETYKNCLITNSVNAIVFFHSEVLLMEQAAEAVT